jgi:hypothetical protein
MMRKNKRQQLATRHASDAASSVTALASSVPRTPPMVRAQRIADAAFRSLVPIVGVLFFHYDAPRLLLLYAFDTVIGLTLTGALTALLTQRLANEGAGNGRSVIANYFDAIVSSALVALMLMVPLMAPLLFIIGFAQGRALLSGDATLWALIAANAAAACASFVVQSATMRTAPESETPLKHNYIFIFFRWLAVLACFFVVGGFIDASDGEQSIGAYVLLFALLLAYNGFTMYGACFPEQIDRIPALLNGHNKRSTLR